MQGDGVSTALVDVDCPQCLGTGLVDDEAEWCGDPDHCDQPQPYTCFMCGGTGRYESTLVLINQLRDRLAEARQTEEQHSLEVAYFKKMADNARDATARIVKEVSTTDVVVLDKRRVVLEEVLYGIRNDIDDVLGDR
jgi:DnaJ-class molecular chaperone